MPLSPDTLARLFGEAAALLRRRLAGPVKALFDAADDSLFELAEHTTDGARQQQYFDGMRECRRRRGEVERAYLHRLDELLHFPPAREPARTVRRLTLLGDEELEEALAVSTMVSKAESTLARPLYALNQRFGFMMAQPDLSDAGNPVGPARLAEAFRQAAELLQMDTQSRLVVFKLFERHVLGALEPLYSELNIQLANADILPTLSAPTPVRAPAPVARAPRAASATPPLPPARDTDARRDEARLLAAVLSALQHHDAPMPPPAGGAMAGLPSAALLGALTRLQQQTAAAGAQDPGAPQAVKAQLLREARRMGAPSATLARQHETTIDLFGLLFDQVGRDDTLPHALQPLLSRLHLPLLKAALADPALLQDDAHPARQLLDELGQAAVGWSPSADPGQRLLARIRDTVDTLLAKFDGDAGMFERLLREFRGYTDATRRRAELAEQRAVEAALGRERLKLARRHVHAALAVRLERHTPSPWMRELLQRPWANYLVLLWLRQGEMSPAFQDALSFADELLWSEAAGATEAERLRLRSVLPALDAQLRQGLATVAYHDSEIEQLAAELAEFVRMRLGEVAPPEFLQRESGIASQTPDPHEAIEDQPEPGSVDADLLERIRAIEPGTWFEFQPGAAEPERAKLSWISPISGRCLFVNRTGLRVAEMPPEELALEIERGLARMLEGATLLQRALGAALAQLRSGSPAAPAPPLRAAGIDSTE